MPVHVHVHERLAPHSNYNVTETALIPIICLCKNRTQYLCILMYLFKFSFLHGISKHFYNLKIPGSYGHVKRSVTNFRGGPNVSPSFNKFCCHHHPAVVGRIVKGLPPSHVCCLQTTRGMIQEDCVKFLK